VSYRHDRIGNLLAQTSDIAHLENGKSVTDLGTLSYGGADGASNRDGRNGSEPGPHALSQISTQAGTSLSYDANGNITQQNGGTLTWDFKDRLVAVEDDASRAEYAYDYKHRRITRYVTPKQSSTNAIPADGKAEVTFYVSPSFEVRPAELPTKYVWNGSTRIARVSGSLSNRPRIQRLRLAAGWNLVSLVVSAPDLLTQLPQSVPAGAHWPAVDAALRWGADVEAFSPLSAGSVPAGTVLWLHATTPGTLSITGQFVEPSAVSVAAETGFVQWPGFEPLGLGGALPEEASVWSFENGSQSWLDRLPVPLASPSTIPATLAPGAAAFIKFGGEPASLDAPDASLRFRYYHQDHLGSSSVTTDSNGQLIEETAYYPYGVVRHVYAPRNTPEFYGFTQKERDSESGLHYFEARYLSATAGRFISVDPAYAEPLQMSAKRFQSFLDNPQDLNLYSYARNNPVIYIDPSGYGLELDVPETKSSPAAKATGVTIMSGHGAWVKPEEIVEKDGQAAFREGATKKDPGLMVVPEGTTITFYAWHGQMISDDLGGAIELQQLDKEQFRVTYHSGDTIPNYALLPPSDLTVFTRPGIKNIQVDHPTSLKELLKPGMGAVHWAACRQAVGVKGSTVDEVQPASAGK